MAEGIKHVGPRKPRGQGYTDHLLEIAGKYSVNKGLAGELKSVETIYVSGLGWETFSRPITWSKN